MEKNDIVLNTEAIISLLMNYDKIKIKGEALINKINICIQKIFEENEEFQCSFNLFSYLVNFWYENSIQGIQLNPSHLNSITYFLKVKFSSS